jgi:wyosine [tRNA(Phe)-imidazoG37] synthetase (radical SAM superfamily)
MKTCTADCVFCQLGPNAKRTMERREYVPTATVLSELRDWLAQSIAADFVTLSGSGEPTLHTGFGAVLDFVRANCALRTALLSNGMLMHLPDVRAAACRAHIVKLSLSAWDQASLERINHPHPDVSFERLIGSYKDFRRAYAGELWLEVFLVPGMNASTDDVARIAARARAVAPDRIHLNTAVRPGADRSVAPLPRESMEELATLFTPVAEVIADFTSLTSSIEAADENTVCAVLRRHPATARQLAESLAIPLPAVTKLLSKLAGAGRISSMERLGEVYYLDTSA